MGSCQQLELSGVELRDAGMAQTAQCHNVLVEQVRKCMRAVAKMRPNRCVTADDAHRIAASLTGGNQNALGNAAGSIFKTDEWEFTGVWSPSQRPSNHARPVRVWRLK